jgi:hypothetical protein
MKVSVALRIVGCIDAIGGWGMVLEGGGPPSPRNRTVVVQLITIQFAE